MANDQHGWEYNVVQLPYNVRARAEALNKLAQERWELVTVVYEGTLAFAYLRRHATGQAPSQPPAQAAA